MNARLPHLRPGRMASIAIATLLLSACMSDPSMKGAPSYNPTGDKPPALSAASEQLAIGTWQWLGTDGPGAASVTAAAPDRYTLKFDGGGRVLVRADCNRGSGAYEVNGNAMTLKPIALTRMGCPDGTQDTLFMQQISRVASYGMRGNELVLTLGDGATMRFRGSDR